MLAIHACDCDTHGDLMLSNRSRSSRALRSYVLEVGVLEEDREVDAPAGPGSRRRDDRASPRGRPPPAPAAVPRRRKPPNSQGERRPGRARRPASTRRGPGAGARSRRGRSRSIPPPGRSTSSRSCVPTRRARGCGRRRAPERARWRRRTARSACVEEPGETHHRGRRAHERRPHRAPVIAEHLDAAGIDRERVGEAVQPDELVPHLPAQLGGGSTSPVCS